MPKNHKTDEFLSSASNKHRKINPTTSTAQEEVVVIVHLVDFHFGSKLLTNFYKIISKFKLNSNIIIQNNILLSNEIIYHTKHYSQSIPPQLLYRGSRDGFKSIDFHSRCDNQGPTLTIIKSSEPYNQIFGGFTTQSWVPYQWISDSSAFIFKIDDENNRFKKFNSKQQEKEYAIEVNYTDYLTVFGGGYDICIYSDCDLNSDSYSNFGDTYELPNNNEYKMRSEKANNYLAGSSNFKVKLKFLKSP